ncbi:MAG: ArnT family glycosyltransferase [Weeksellaceae bacterium]
MFDIYEICRFFKKQFTRTDVLMIIGLIGLFLLTRLINLDKWPIFSDEGIYIRWAKVAWRDASWRFISLTDGRQPLQTWATIPFLKLFPENALLAGRLFAVTMGSITLTGVFTMMFYLWGKRAAFLGALLYICMPYFVFYDRMALVDSAVNAGFVWVLFLSIVMARTLRLDIAIILGITAGLSLLAKSSARMFMLLTVLAPVLYLGNPFKKFLKKNINYLFLFGIVVVIATVLYNVQRLSPFFHFVALKNTTFVMTFDEFKSNPFMNFWRNIQLIPQYTIWEAGWFIFLFSVAGFYKLFRSDKPLFLYLMAYVVFPFIALSFFAKVVFPRYLIHFGMLYLISATYFFTMHKARRDAAIMYVLLIGSMIVLNLPFWFAPSYASFPPVDRGQYVEGVSAVWGAKDLMEHVRKESQQKPALVLAEGNFGLVADVLDVYLQEGDQIEIKGLWPLEEKHLIEYQPELAKRTVFIVYSHRQEFPPGWPHEFVTAYSKPNSDKKLYLYKLTQVAIPEATQ